MATACTTASYTVLHIHKYGSARRAQFVTQRAPCGDATATVTSHSTDILPAFMLYDRVQLAHLIAQADVQHSNAVHII
jgi:hypothetical protein